MTKAPTYPNASSRNINSAASQVSKSAEEKAPSAVPASESKPAESKALSIQPLPAGTAPSESPNIRLSHRDFKIFEFVLDMKFASHEALFQKFFSVTRDSESAKSDEGCRKRLGALARAGYLTLDPNIKRSGRFYIATDLAHKALNTKLQLEKVPKPRRCIDQTVFVHDLLVAVSRLEFEEANPGCRWTSDLRLRTGLAALYNLPSVYIPDAIYELSSGERVAFEFENARKGRNAYREKISYFAKLIEAKRDDVNMFTRVRYRCVRPDVFKILQEETSLYPGMFSVELWEVPAGFQAGGSEPVPKYLREVL